MKIRREWLGGAEDIDLNTLSGWEHWVYDVHQDHDAAGEVYNQLRREECVIINTNDPVYIERYTRYTKAEIPKEMSHEAE